MRIAALALVAGAALVLAACTPVPPDPTRTPSPSATPAFASEEEALAAAEEAYKAYLAKSAEIARGGGVAVDEIAPMVTTEQLARERKDYAFYTDNNFHSVGDPAVVRTKLAQTRSTFGGGAEVEMYVCVDVESVRILDASGTDVTSAGRATRTALDVTMVSDAEQARRLLVGDSSQWSGSGVC
jgi:hypothetical protein